jgi:Ni,Fe-hydrogenase I large subunit
VTKVHDLDLYEDSQIQEFVVHSWYDYRGGNDQDLHPCMGETILDDPNNLVTSDVTGIMIKVQTCAVRFLTGGDTSMFGLA